MSVNSHPLEKTAQHIGESIDWATVRCDVPTAPELENGWVRCADADSIFIAEWEDAVTTMLLRDFQRHHRAASTSYVLDWYAAIPGYLGGLSFALANRVPRLDRPSLFFHRHPQHAYPDGLALARPEFWCLASDPDATHPDATVVASAHHLAAVLRQQVSAHARDFLAAYEPRVRIPRRHRLGAFFDGLDTALSMARTTPAEAIELGHVVLPKDTTDFPFGSTLYRVHDAQGREHLTRTRVSCCYYFKVSDGGIACATCPRTSAAERAERVVAFAGGDD
ncbi:(2Fe-2S)-binding protein [Hoyosella sp. YIM 151337]|uniref:(2Fe-2S)-binding protein n=1 Tax=Hoyosella sp. YIM 151337 TaxID=2992742 RepID=UPI00223584F2|nr:(2Fe-2S)-binding protein [Hoyosella sp. YIM 151337]MCW4353107.1 (2Fe-2S)-binding protein [Hoyosella sp. YIM 151337]